VAFQEPLSVAELQSHTHDTIAGEVVEVLASIATDSPHGPFSVLIGTHQCVGFRISASSFPSVPPHDPEALEIKYYTRILVQNISLSAGTPD